jgi:hypothetical protein
MSVPALRLRWDAPLQRPGWGRISRMMVMSSLVVYAAELGMTAAFWFMTGRPPDTRPRPGHVATAFV